MKCPIKNDLWKAELVKDFSTVPCREKRNERSFTFRSLITLPPYLERKFVDTGILEPSELGFLTIASRKTSLEDNKDLEKIESIENDLGHTLSFLWTVSNESIPSTPHAISNKREVTQWRFKIHEVIIRSVL